MSDHPQRHLAPGQMDLVLADDGTTVLITTHLRDMEAPSSEIIVTLWCGGNDEHCGVAGWCEHTRALAEANAGIPGRQVVVLERHHGQ